MAQESHSGDPLINPGDTIEVLNRNIIITVDVIQEQGIILAIQRHNNHGVLWPIEGYKEPVVVAILTTRRRNRGTFEKMLRLA